MPVCPPSHAPPRVNMVDPDEIAKLCYERFQQLPRRGKPEPGREWTLLAAVLRITRRANSDTVEKEVVSLGTGTKCIGQTAMSPSGDILNDSHAEVIARRGCVRYLIQELYRAVSGGGSAVFCQAEEQGKWRLHPGVSFLFFTSHTPCESCSLHVEELNLINITSVSAISWCNVPEQPLDVTANGYKHGVTRKALGTAKARSLLCKLELFHSFLSLVAATAPAALPPPLRGAELLTYWDYKQAAQSYQQAWQQLLSQAFPLWPRTDRGLLLFH
ncbi:LOW QUALITY PROTEIN: tRNA-specific adenosine deaminase 1 [Pseudochaenichthys georgianus]|uniref:LOW QUALITY PROTEIN: tRNA-specific adenosine deaminase 1 n=1 Tax=Pseudochaenichthys georgianus TaxID=52239 RepID=UPI00146EA982|nr:LOW QUALITY PROTEIN: tRNA-specific adenosine deaminase 1 [Pseudochaenichthys georgianus]